MKKVILSALSAVLLSACAASFPQTPSEMKGMASTSMFVEELSYSVSRSSASVASSFRTLSHKCLNRTTQSNQVYRVGPYGPQSLLFMSRFETSVHSTGQGAELAMRMIPIRGGINEPKEGYIFFVADVAPNGAGATVTHYQGSVGGGAFSKAVQDWAEGNTTACPEMPR